MANKVNNDAMLQRMKSLMTYGINESKQPEYSTVEHSKVAADGKLYGIVREGANFYIKEAKDAKAGLVSENFEYIGGFRNRKENCFESFAAASRYFDEKMININESLDRIQKNVIAENYINEKKDVIAEQTEKMQKEIARQRQIMENAQNIMEKKACACEPVKGKGADANSKSPKCDAKDCGEEIKDYNGKPIKAEGGNIFNQSPKMPKNESVEGKETMNESEAPLCSRENPDYMDKSHGTEIGTVDGFGEPVESKPEGAVADAEGGQAENTETPENVNEEVAMHDAQNQNSPAPGVNEKGDQAPFEEKVNESLDDMDDTLEDDVDDFDVEDADAEGEEMVDEPMDEPVEEPEVDDADIEADVEAEGDDTNARIDALEAKLDKILDAINNIKYDDDEELYDEEAVEDDTEEGADADYDLEMDGEEPAEEEVPTEEDECVVRESKSFKAMKARMMNEENRLDDFGKHPAYQKKVMSLPQNQNRKVNGQYDVNDASVDGEQPYGQQKGDTAPFNVDREKVENEIVENVLRTLKKKLG